MRKVLSIAFVFALVLAVMPTTASAVNVVTGTFNFCWGWLEDVEDGQWYGGDTFTNQGFFAYYPEKNTVVFKCTGELHAGSYPPPVADTFEGDRPYWYWETNALDWSFGFYDPLFGPATGSTRNVKITVMPDGTWILIAKARLP